ncbi:hypothetical protein DV736_g6363, partial [Chaetothyriales sp. CBS 134916]
MQLTTLLPLAITLLSSAAAAAPSSSPTNRRHASPIDVNSYFDISCPGTSVPAEQYITFGIAQAKDSHDDTNRNPNIWSSWVAVCCPADAPNLDTTPDPITEALKCYNIIYDNPNSGKPAPRG